MTTTLATPALAGEPLCERAAPFEVLHSANSHGGASGRRGTGYSDDEHGGDGLTLTGYASVWDSPTEIRSAFEGHFTESFQRGAFEDSLKRHTPVMQWDHGKDITGSVPIGRFTELVEDAHGLRVTARLYDNEAVRPIRDAVAGGSVAGMSVRFIVTDDEWFERRGELPHRVVKAVDLRELGPVCFPAYPATSVGMRGGCLTPGQRDSQFRELWLRRVHGRWALGGP